MEEVTIYHIQIASLPVSADKIIAETQRDTVLMSVLKFLKIGQWPKSLQQRILKELHNQHPGIVRMKSLSRIHVWYPKIGADIEHMVKSCENCTSVANEPPKSRDHPCGLPNHWIEFI